MPVLHCMSFQSQSLIPGSSHAVWYRQTSIYRPLAMLRIPVREEGLRFSWTCSVYTRRVEGARAAVRLQTADRSETSAMRASV